MGYYVSNMIGLRVGGVLSGGVKMDDLKNRIAKIVLEMRDDENEVDPNIIDKDFPGDPSYCLSRMLTGPKGDYAVMAGVFNRWKFSAVSEFARRLSNEFGIEVMLMSWDEEKDSIQSEVYLDGLELSKTRELSLQKRIRRIF